MNPFSDAEMAQRDRESERRFHHAEFVRHHAEYTAPGWLEAGLTDEQRAARAAQEEAMRNGELRGLPTAFNDLDEAS